MELYIEKKFLDDFHETYDNITPSKGKRAIAQILESYGNIDWFIDFKYETPEELEYLESKNPYFAARSNYSAPQSVRNLKDHFLDNSKCEQTLIFCFEAQDWFKEAERRGALCFALNNYENKIEDIISKCHIRGDLNEDFNGWKWFEFLNRIPSNYLNINDNYILADRGDRIINKNLIPLLSVILCGKEGHDFDLKIFTLEFKPLSKSAEKKKEKAKKRFKYIKEYFKQFQKLNLQIISNERGKYHGFNFHDRIIYSNFLIVECGRGFNLLPKNKNENSKIESSSIFDKFYYNRIAKQLRMHKEYLQKMKAKDSSKYYFLYYP